MTALEREMAADAVALSREHADRADAAEARWAALRKHIAGERATQDEQAAEHAEYGRDWSASLAYGAVRILDRLLATMDQMEADR